MCSDLNGIYICQVGAVIVGLDQYFNYYKMQLGL
jgi:hypothetical protein